MVFFPLVLRFLIKSRTLHPRLNLDTVASCLVRTRRIIMPALPNVWKKKLQKRSIDTETSRKEWRQTSEWTSICWRTKKKNHKFQSPAGQILGSVFLAFLLLASQVLPSFSLSLSLLASQVNVPAFTHTHTHTYTSRKPFTIFWACVNSCLDNDQQFATFH